MWSNGVHCTQIWEKSDDENLEILVDEAVKKVLQCESIWNKKECIEMLYNDGLDEEDSERKKTNSYWQFVHRIYAAIGGNTFFDHFVAEQYQREIGIWKHRMETMKRLNTKGDVEKMLTQHRLVFTFEKFDIDGNNRIDFREFKSHIEHQGFKVDTDLLREVLSVQ